MTPDNANEVTMRATATNSESHAMKQPRSTGQRREAVVRSEAGAATEPSRDAIAERAFALHVAGGRTDGHDLDDWLEAERELRRRARTDSRA